MSKLRIDSVSQGPEVTLRINGQKVSARRGESVHAALLAAGYQVLRTTRNTAEPRGVFCGMGICYECLVTINGQPNQRACMWQVEDDMEIELGPF